MKTNEIHWEVTNFCNLHCYYCRSNSGKPTVDELSTNEALNALKKFHDAKWFYIIIGISLIAGLSMNYVGISPIKALLYSAILYGLTAPVLIAMILHICNNKKIMDGHLNGPRANILGVATFLLMSVAAVALLYFMI